MKQRRGTAHQPYASPSLVRYGTLQELTRGTKQITTSTEQGTNLI